MLYNIYNIFQFDANRFGKGYLHLETHFACTSAIENEWISLLLDISSKTIMVVLPELAWFRSKANKLVEKTQKSIHKSEFLYSLLSNIFYLSQLLFYNRNNSASFNARNKRPHAIYSSVVQILLTNLPTERAIYLFTYSKSMWIRG